MAHLIQSLIILIILIFFGVTSGIYLKKYFEDFTTKHLMYSISLFVIGFILSLLIVIFGS